MVGPCRRCEAIGRRVVVPVLVAALTLAGCTTAGGRAPVASAAGAVDVAAPVPSGGPAARPQPDRTLWTVKLKPFGQPDVYGSAVVVTTSAKGRLYVRGFRLDDGEPLWRTEMTPSGAAPVVASGYATVHDRAGREYIAFYEPSFEPFRAVLTVVDPATGKVMARAPSGYFNAPPAECPSGHDVCVAYARPGELYTPYRLRIDTASFTKAPGQPPGSLRVGPELFRLEPTERLVHVTDGTKRWARRVRALFPAGSTTASGWRFFLYPDSGMYVGQVGGTPKKLREVSGDRWVPADSRWYATAGFEEATGHGAWQQPETTLCVIAMPSVGSTTPYPVRCRVAGRFAGGKFRLRQQVLEGFDVRTGRTTWSLDTDVSRPFAVEGGALPVLSRTARIVMSRDERPLVVDLGTGTTVPVSAVPTAAACLKAVSATYKKSEAFLDADGQPYRTRWGGTVARPCDATGAKSAAPFAYRTVAAVGSQNDDGTVAVLSTASQLVAVSAS